MDAAILLAEHSIADLSVGGIFSLLVIDRVFKFIKDRKVDEADDEQGKLLLSLSREVHELHQWHDRRDADGVPVWYVRTSLERAVADLTKKVDRLGTVIDALARRTEV